MLVLRRAWRGEERLWKVWWLIGLPLWFAVNFAFFAVCTLVADDPINFPLIFLFVAVASLVAVWLAWMVAAWRCAPNVEHSAWRLAARATLLLLPVLSSVANRNDASDFGERLAAHLGADAQVQGIPDQQLAQTAGEFQTTPTAALPVLSRTISDEKVIVDPFKPAGSQVFDPSTDRPLNPDELNATGLQYLTGPASEKDEKQRYLSAIYFFTQAAEAGSLKGQHNLGVAYSLGGGGLAADNVQSMKWLTIAAANGSPDSMKFLEDVAARSTSTEIAEANAMAEEWWSAHR